jgi:hypothetical protein
LLPPQCSEIGSTLIGLYALIFESANVPLKSCSDEY